MMSRHSGRTWLIGIRNGQNQLLLCCCQQQKKDQQNHEKNFFNSIRCLIKKWAEKWPDMGFDSSESRQRRKREKVSYLAWSRAGICCRRRWSRPPKNSSLKAKAPENGLGNWRVCCSSIRTDCETLSSAINVAVKSLFSTRTTTFCQRPSLTFLFQTALFRSPPIETVVISSLPRSICRRRYPASLEADACLVVMLGRAEASIRRESFRVVRNWKETFVRELTLLNWRNPSVANAATLDRWQRRPARPAGQTQRKSSCTTGSSESNIATHFEPSAPKI